MSNPIYTYDLFSNEDAERAIITSDYKILDHYDGIVILCSGKNYLDEHVLSVLSAMDEDNHTDRFITMILSDEFYSHIEKKNLYEAFKEAKALYVVSDSYGKNEITSYDISLENIPEDCMPVDRELWE